MNPRNVILVSLGVLELLAATAAVIAFEDGLPWKWAIFPVIAVIYVQPYLIGIWVAFGERTLPWRLVAVAAGLTGLSQYANYAPIWMTLVVLVSIPGISLVLGLLLLARAFGLNFYDSLTRIDSQQAPAFQYSIRHMLEWTAAIAVLCSLAAMAPPELPGSLYEAFVDDGVQLCSHHGLLAATSLACVIVVLAMHRVWLGLAFLVPSGLLLAYLFHQPLRSAGWEIVVLSGCLMAWITFCLLPVRLFGYRYGWRPRAAGNECPFQEPPDLAD